MIEERRAPIEAHLDSLKELRKAYLSHYRFLEGNASEEYLSSILDDVHQLEVEIMEVKQQLPPPMSQRQLRALEEIPKVWAEVTGKKVGDEDLWDRMEKAHEEALNEALHRDLWARFDKPKEEALCEAADKTLQEYADIAAGRAEPADVADYEESPVELHHSANGDKRFEGALEDVCSVEGQYEVGRMTITPVRRGFKEWLKDWFR